MYYTVRNLTNVSQSLRDFEGDTVVLGPNATKNIDKKFLDFQTPPMSIIKIIAGPPTPDGDVSLVVDAPPTENEGQ